MEGSHDCCHHESRDVSRKRGTDASVSGAVNLDIYLDWYAAAFRVDG